MKSDKIVASLQKQIDEIEYAKKYAKNKGFVGGYFKTGVNSNVSFYYYVERLDSDGELVGVMIHRSYPDVYELIYNLAFSFFRKPIRITKEEFDAEYNRVTGFYK